MSRYKDHPFARELRRSRITQISAAVAVLYLFVGFAGPWLAPYDSLEMVSGPRLSPSVEHWMGTDEIGRDTFSRVLVGSRVALIVGFVAIGIGLLVGGAVGLLAGFYGRIVDSISMRLMDVLLAFPGLLLALAVLTFLGTGLVNTMIAIGIGGIPGYARLVRGEVMGRWSTGTTSWLPESLGAGNARLMTPAHPAPRNAERTRVLHRSAGQGRPVRGRIELPWARGSASGPIVGAP